MPGVQPVRHQPVIRRDHARPLLAGEWFVEPGPEILRVFRDAEGIDHVADVNVVDFLEGLATRTIVFVSWG